MSRPPKMKIKILELIERGYRTSEEIANILGKSRVDICALLNLYTKQGLVTRSRLRGRMYVYSLTPRGKARLDYYRSRG